MQKSDKPRLIATNYFALRDFLLFQGRNMQTKRIGTATYASIELPEGESPYMRIFAYGLPIIRLNEDKPHQIRFMIRWNTPSDRGRISQFLPADTAIFGKNYEPTLIRDDGTNIVLERHKEYIWDSEKNTLLQPKTKEIS